MPLLRLSSARKADTRCSSAVTAAGSRSASEASAFKSRIIPAIRSTQDLSGWELNSARRVARSLAVIWHTSSGVKLVRIAVATSNETKVSDDHLERASIGVEVY